LEQNDSESKILFVGVGTGADLEFINHSEFDITAIDFSPDMLERARAKFHSSSIKFVEMDAQDMNFDDESFDVVIGSLILSVVPNPDQCFQEMTRVLNYDGDIILFNKFVPKENKLSLPKRVLRPVIKMVGTDIGLNFEDMYEQHHQKLTLEEDKSIMFGGMYRKIVIRK